MTAFTFPAKISFRRAWRQGRELLSPLIRSSYQVTSSMPLAFAPDEIYSRWRSGFWSFVETRTQASSMGKMRSHSNTSKNHFSHRHFRVVFI